MCTNMIRLPDPELQTPGNGEVLTLTIDLCIGPRVLPLVPSILEAMEGEMAQYQRLIVFWPQFGPLLEASMCAALRDTITATARQCGLVQVHAAAAVFQLISTSNTIIWRK